MASYQIPQFLDSGDKILFNMNFRQFGYALGAAFLCLLIYTIVNAVYPMGAFAIAFCIPVAFLGLYLALGKYNGRDSEVYVLKMILFFFKPRRMIYARQPDFSEVNTKLSQVTYEKILARWSDEVNKQKNKKQEKTVNFQEQGVEDKIRFIQNLAKNKIDEPLNNAMIRVGRGLGEIENKEEMLRNIQAGRDTKNPLLANSNLPANQAPKPQNAPSEETNFFGQ